MYKSLFVAGSLLALAAQTTVADAQARPWCDKDCIALCKRTVPTGVTVGQCITRHQCWTYRGKPCAGSGVIAKRAKVYRETHPKK